MTYLYEEELIRVDDDTKDILVEKTEFLDDKDFIRMADHLILWVDWMNYTQFDEVAKILNIKY